MNKKLLLLIFTIFTFVNIFNIHQLNAVGLVYQGVANYESGTPTILYRTSAKPSIENIKMLKNRGVAYNTWNYSSINLNVDSTKSTYEARYLIFTKEPIGNYTTSSKGTNTGYGYLEYKGELGLQGDKYLGDFFKIDGGNIVLNSSEGTVKYINKNTDIDEWLFDYSSITNNNFTVVTYDSSEWNDYLNNIYGTNETLNSFVNVFKKGNLIKWTSIANKNTENNWIYTENISGKTLPGVLYKEYRMMLFNPSVVGNNSSALANSVYVADMFLDKNVTADLLSLGKEEVLVSTLSQTLTDKGEAWLLTPGSFLHGLTANYESNNWSNMTRGVDYDNDPFALGSGLNLWDNKLILPTGDNQANDIEVYVRHVNVVKNENGRKQYKLIDRTNHYSVTQPNKGSDLDHSLWSWDKQYQELVAIPSGQNEIGIKTLNTSKTWTDEDGNVLDGEKFSIVGYDVASFNDLDDLHYIGYPSAKYNVGSDGININLNLYDDNYIYVYVYYQGEEEPEEEKETYDVIERHVLVNNYGTVTKVLEETTHTFEEGEYTRDYPKKFNKKYAPYEYMGYSINSSSNVYEEDIYEWYDSRGNVTVTFKYKKEDIVITQEDIPEINLEGLLEVDSAQGFNTTCLDETNSQIESVPGNAVNGDNDLEVGVTGIPAYILGGVEVKDVTRSGTLTYNINMSFADKTKSWTIEVPYSASRIAIENILVYKLTDPIIYNTDKGYDTSGSSVFDWTSKDITNPNVLTYNKDAGSNEAKYIVNSPEDIYTYYYNYNDKDYHGVISRYYKTWSDGYYYDNYTDDLGIEYISYAPDIDITVDGNYLNEYSYIDNWFDNNNKTVSININLLDTEVYNAINYYASGNILNGTDLTQIGNKVTSLISNLDSKVTSVINAWDELKDAESELEEVLANEVLEPTQPEKPDDYEVNTYKEELERNAYEKIYYYYYNSFSMDKSEFNDYYRIDTSKSFNIGSEKLLWNALKYILDQKDYTADFIRFNIYKTGSSSSYAYNNNTYAINTYTYGTDNYYNYCQPYYNCLDRVEYEYIKNNSFNMADDNIIYDWLYKTTYDYAIDHDNYTIALETYNDALEEWEITNSSYITNLNKYNAWVQKYNLASNAYNTAENTFYSKLEDYNEILTTLKSLAIRENYARTYYDEAVALQATYNEYSKKTAKQMAQIFNLQVYLESTNDDASMGDFDIFNKNLFNMQNNGTFNISDYLTTYGTKVAEGNVKVETDYPRVDKSLYTDGFYGVDDIGFYEDNAFEIPKTKLNGKRILAGYIRYKIVPTGDTPLAQDFKDNVYYDGTRTQQTVFEVDGSRVIDKDYGVSEDNSQEFNIYTPLVVGADVELEQGIVNQSQKDYGVNSDVIQANSAFKIVFKTNYDDVPGATDVYGAKSKGITDFTSRYRLKYYIRFDFDVNNVKYINEYGSMQTSAYVAKDKWIGPIYGDNITAVPYFNTSADESFGENANGYYVIAVAVNARESWTELLKEYLTKPIDPTNPLSDLHTLDTLTTDTLNKLKDLTNPCGVEGNSTKISYYADCDGNLSILNRMYDFRVTDVADVNWKNVFRENSSSAYVNQHSGLAYYSGLTKWNTLNSFKYNEIVGRTEEEIGGGSVLRVLPVGPYKNTSPTYISAPRLGYKFSFDLKVTGAAKAEKYVEITPSFYYISKDGKTFEENIDLYYKNSNGKYVKVDSSSDKYNIQFIPNDGYRALIKTDLNNLSNKSISIGTLKKLKLNFKEVTTYSENSSTITYYGEYKLPNSTIAVKRGGNINNPLTDGYIGVKFNIIANEANGEEETTYLSYSKNALKDDSGEVINSSQWDFEGYLGITKQGESYSTSLRLEKGTWNIDNDTYNKIKGTVILYDLDHRASNDFN